MQSRTAVAIVGAGFSGSLLALHLLESGPEDLTIFLIEYAAQVSDHGDMLGAAERKIRDGGRRGRAAAAPSWVGASAASPAIWRRP
jgi:glycine/D-amino acid oxidase-like deaminating enzyme